MNDLNANRSQRIDPRLNVMMFLEYAVKGLWFPLASVFLSASIEAGGLGFTDSQKGAIIGLAAAVGAICAPFVAGQVADRWFNTERFLAVSLFLAGALQIVIWTQNSFPIWLGLSILFSILYMPTMALTNSLAMIHLPDPKRQFARVRLWGTIGWIAVAWIFPMVWLQSDLRFQVLPPFFKGTAVPDVESRMVDSMVASGVVTMCYAVYCWLALPKTPPSDERVKSVAFAKAFAMLGRRSFAVLLGVALVVSCLHTLYFIHMSNFLKVCGLSSANIMPAMSIGQFSEIAVMAILGAALARYGFKTVMLVGLCCYVLRFAVFGIPGVSVEVVVAAQALHGFCFACFYAAGFIYVDRIAPRDVRHSAQTVFNLVIFGAGPALAGWLVNGLLVSMSTTQANLDRQSFAMYWQFCALGTVAAGVVFTGLFQDLPPEDADDS